VGQRGTGADGAAMTASRTVAVIGAAGGIGASVVEHLATRGHAVVAVGRSIESLRKATAPLREQGYPIAEFALDLAQATDGDELVAFTLESFGRIDALVNTAAVYLPSEATNLDQAQWSQTMDTNLRGPLLVASSAARQFMRQRSGRIVHISSITALVSRGGYTLYEASKAGIVAATRSMAVELAPHGVAVNSVAPGWVRTPMTEGFLAECTPASIAELIPAGRVGEPGEIAQVTGWLATECPGFLTGQTIVVDGGQTARTAYLSRLREAEV
jgi:NAD(P)-dependent dehydrogenase (short-subunit alcohol dehydrogenase family)